MKLEYISLGRERYKNVSPIKAQIYTPTQKAYVSLNKPFHKRHVPSIKLPLTFNALVQKNILGGSSKLPSNLYGGDS